MEPARWTGSGAAENAPLLSRPNRNTFSESLEGSDIVIPGRDGADLMAVDRKSSRSAGLPSAIFNTTNTIIGGGVLALPFAFANAGLIVGVALVILIALLSFLSSHYLAILVRYCQKKNGRSYRSVAMSAFGFPGAFAVDVCFVLFLFGGAVGYVVIMGDILTPYFEQVTGWSEKPANRYLVEAVVTLCFAYPLCLLKKIDYLKYTSFAALICICYMVIVIGVESYARIEENFEAHNVVYANASLDLFQAFPVITFAFAFHMQQFAIQNEMIQPGRIRIVVGFAIAFSAICYLIVGVFGYLAFFESANSNILTSFDDNIPIIIGKIALVFIILFSFPVLHFPLRQAVMSLIFPLASEPAFYDWLPHCLVPSYRHTTLVIVPNPANADSGNDSVGSYPSSGDYTSSDDIFDSLDADVDGKPTPQLPCLDDLVRHVTVTTIVVYLIYLTAIAIPNISTIFGLVGATVGSAMIFILPPLLIIKLRPAPLLSVEKIAALIFAIVGTVFGLVGTYVTIANW
jgi:amino acid permease